MLSTQAIWIPEIPEDQKKHEDVQNYNATVKNKPNQDLQSYLRVVYSKILNLNKDGCITMLPSPEPNDRLALLLGVLPLPFLFLLFGFFLLLLSPNAPVTRPL